MKKHGSLAPLMAAAMISSSGMGCLPEIMPPKRIPEPKAKAPNPERQAAAEAKRARKAAKLAGKA